MSSILNLPIEDRIRLVEDIWDTIADNPQIYPVIHRDSRGAVINKFPFGLYIRVENNLIIIVAVMHASREPSNWKKRS